MKRFASFLLALLIFMTVLASCSDRSLEVSAPSPGEDVTAGETDAPVVYEYPDVDYDNADFAVLTPENIWDIHMEIDYEKMTGDVLEDTIYNRNRYVEEKLGFKLITHTVPIDDVPTAAKNAITADDDAYQVVYIGANLISPLISANYLNNLLDIPELQLDEDWWEQSVINEGTIGTGASSALYFAASDLNLTTMDGTWCILFNEDMMTNLGLEKPYDMVREGTWTLDRLIEYAQAGADMKGAESFGWDTDGEAVYGMTSFNAASAALIFASGERFIKKDETNYPIFALETDRFYAVAEKIAKLNGTPGQYLSANETAPDPFHYERIFKSGRALIVGAEIKSATAFRDVEFTFGLIPFPKFDESQEEYCSMMLYQLMLATIPMTNPNIEQAAVILDALSFEAQQQVLPIYYDVYVSQKGLRNEDSIEMLAIVRNNRYFNLGNTYGWTTSLYDSIRDTLDKGSSDLASKIASQKSIIEKNIQKTMDAFLGD